MIRSIDVVNRNFNVLQEKQKNLSANATNVNTPGFKYQSLIQSTLPRELAINHADGPRLDQRQELGEYAFGNQIDEAVIHMDEGDLQETGIPTDFAISGDGFFTVQGPEGELYTQNGRFTVNETGQLVTREGYPVLTTGPASFNQNTIIDDNGFINGTDSQFVLTSFGEDADALETVGEGYFSGAGGTVNAANSTVHQGYIETANIDIADVMVEMLQISREFEANQAILQASNETLQKATNDVGRV